MNESFTNQVNNNNKVINNDDSLEEFDPAN